MGLVKWMTTWIPRQNAMFRLENAHPSWEMHPDWVQAMKSLDSFNLWVGEVVMPIAFQWIEEHKEEVYRSIPEDQRDDVGVVIAKAFDIVSRYDLHKRGIELAQRYETEIKDSKFDYKKINPVWQEMSSKMDEAKNAVKRNFKEVLGDTIR